MASKKGGTGRGTGKKGWTRWQKGENRKKNAPKPYTSKGKGKETEAKPETGGKSGTDGE